MKDLTMEYLNKGGEAKMGIKLGEGIDEKEKKSCCAGNKNK